MSRRNSHRDRYDDEEEEEDEEEDDYEDDGFVINDEDEDEEEYGYSKSTKKKTKSARSLLIDDAAIDSDGEEDELEDEEEEGFIDYDSDQPEVSSRPSQYVPKPIMEEENLEEIANNFNRRFQQSESFRSDGGMLSRSVLPTNSDPSLWMLRCKPGKEKDILLTLMKRSVNHQRLNKPYGIESAFYRDNLKGYIYIEAYKSGTIQKAVSKIPDLYISKITLIPRKEMTEVLNIKNKITDLAQGQWARVKKGKYANDLCQIIRIIDAQNLVRVKLIPRLDIFMENGKDSASSNSKRGPQNQARPPQRLFDRREVEMANTARGAVVKNRGFYIYNGESFREGFLEKNFKAAALITAKVNPTYEEITSFADAYDDEKAKSTILSTLTAPLIAAQHQSGQLQVGDFVEIIEGSMKSILGTLEKIEADEAIVTPQVRGLQKISVALNHIRKCYREGDYVKVVAGKFKGETGSVVRVTDNVATVISDNNTKQIQVFTKDLGEANLSNPTTNTSAKFRVHEIVQLDHHNVGVIVKLNNDTYKILDQNGLVKDVKSQNLTSLVAPRKAVAIDSRGNPINVGDQVRATHVAGRQGTILHICKGIAFIKSQEDNDTAGVFVEKTHFLMSLTPVALKSRSTPNKTADGFVIPTVMPPAANRGGNRGGNPGRSLGRGGLRRRDPLVEKTVLIRTGPYKGLLGIVKDIIENLARVELHTTFRIVTVDKTCVSLPGEENDSRSNSSYNHYGASPRPRNFHSNSSNWSSTPSHPGGAQSSGFHSRAGSNYSSRNSTPSHAGNRGGSYASHNRNGNATPNSNNYRTPSNRTPNQNRPSWGNTRKQPNPGSAWESNNQNTNQASSALSWDFGNNAPKEDLSWDFGNISTKEDNPWDSKTPARAASKSGDQNDSWDFGNLAKDSVDDGQDQSWNSVKSFDKGQANWGTAEDNSAEDGWNAGISTSRKSKSSNKTSSRRDDWGDQPSDSSQNSWSTTPKPSSTANSLASPGRSNQSNDSQAWDSNWGASTPNEPTAGDNAWDAPIVSESKKKTSRETPKHRDSWGSDSTANTFSNDSDWAKPSLGKSAGKPADLDNWATPTPPPQNIHRSGKSSHKSNNWSNDSHDSNREWNTAGSSTEDSWSQPVWDERPSKSFSKHSDDFAAPSPAMLNPITPGGAVPFTPGGEISFTPSDTMSFLAPLGPNLSPEASHDLAPLSSKEKKYRN